MSDAREIEKLTEEVEILLRRCTLDELKNIAVDLEVSEVDKLTRRKILRAIEDKITETEGDDDERKRLLKDLDFPVRLKEQQEALFRNPESMSSIQAENGRNPCQIPANHYVHIEEGLTGLIRVELGPKQVELKDNETVITGPLEMIKVPRMYYCVIENPVKLNNLDQPQLDTEGRVILKQGEIEVRNHQDPFPLYPGEILKIPPKLIIPDTDEGEEDRFLRGRIGVESRDQGPRTSSPAGITLHEEALTRELQRLTAAEVIRTEVRGQLDRERRNDDADRLEETLRSLGIGGNARTSTFRREFRINGIVGGSKKENRLDYLSLCSQITEAKQKGYEEDEICFAVKKAISPSSEIKPYIDSLEKPDLKELLACVRSAYQEKSASALFQDLNKLCQESEEDAQAFMFRALGLRQKVLAASEVDEEIPYDAPLIQSVFLHAVLTGIKSESVRSHMKPFLEKNRRTKDKELIEEIAKACSEQKERLSKIAPTEQRRFSRVNEVTTGFEELVKPLTETMTAISNQMKDMQSRFENLERSGKSSWKRNKCQKCSDSGEIQCNHCYKCGGEGHMSRNCQGQTISIHCFKCGGEGHLPRNCPSPLN